MGHWCEALLSAVTCLADEASGAMEGRHANASLKAGEHMVSAIQAYVPRNPFFSALGPVDLLPGAAHSDMPKPIAMHPRDRALVCCGLVPRKYTAIFHSCVNDVVSSCTPLRLSPA